MSEWTVLGFHFFQVLELYQPLLPSFYRFGGGKKSFLPISSSDFK